MNDEYRYQLCLTEDGMQALRKALTAYSKIVGEPIDEDDIHVNDILKNFDNHLIDLEE